MLFCLVTMGRVLLGSRMVVAVAFLLVHGRVQLGDERLLETAPGQLNIAE